MTMTKELEKDFTADQMIKIFDTAANLAIAVYNERHKPKIDDLWILTDDYAQNISSTLKCYL